MVNLITAKITNQPIISNSAANIQVLEQSKTAPVYSEIPKSNDKLKSILPFGLITGGALLIAYGLTRPGKVKCYKNLVQDRLFQIEKNVQEFANFTKDLMDNSFNNSKAHIDWYRENRMPNVTKYVDAISFSQDSKSALELQDKAFQAISTEFNEYIHPGASEFDRFKAVLFDAVREVTNNLNCKRSQKNIACGDLTLIPKLKEDKYSDLVEASEGQLFALANSAAQNMLKIQNKQLHEVVNAQTQEMAEAIINSRNMVSESKKALIDVAFDRIGRLLKLSDNFKPSYSNTLNLEHFEKLTPEELKVSKLPSTLNGIFSGNAYWEAVKTRDFSSLSNEDLKHIFYSATPYTDINEIGIMIDRLRLRNELDKSVRKNNETVYKTAIAKLEYLAVKLKDIGESELMLKCKQDFDNLSVEQRKAKLYYIHQISKRLGFNTIGQMDEYYAKNNEAYVKMPIRKYVEIIKENPDMYFI